MPRKDVPIVSDVTPSVRMGNDKESGDPKITHDDYSIFQFVLKVREDSFSERCDNFGVVTRGNLASEWCTIQEVAIFVRI